MAREALVSRAAFCSSQGARHEFRSFLFDTHCGAFPQSLIEEGAFFDKRKLEWTESQEVYQ
jgi:hypothetical protein